MLGKSPLDVSGGGFPHLYSSVLLESYEYFSDIFLITQYLPVSQHRIINSTAVSLQLSSIIHWYRQILALHRACRGIDEILASMLFREELRVS